MQKLRSDLVRKLKWLKNGWRGKRVLIIADSKSGIRKLSKLARGLGWWQASRIGLSAVTGDWYRWFKRR